MNEINDLSRSNTLNSMPIDRKLSAHDLISEVHGLLQRVDTGRDSCYDTIAQHELMKSIARRVNAAAMLSLIEAWLDVATEESRSSPRVPHRRKLNSEKLFRSYALP